MVERPIKKSERQAKIEADGNSQSQDFKPSPDSNRGGRAPERKERSSGRGKKSSADEFKPPVNPALARPPKPPKAPAKKEVEEVAQVEDQAQVAVEESQESVAES
ncbi:MAG: hypothetical protein HC908_00895 [Calothrix sp. SM1_7_51]|nr:hypothetical protein [Calothrix sp. SM1_7_51]